MTNAFAARTQMCPTRDITIREATHEDVASVLGMLRELATHEQILDTVTVTEESLRLAIFGPKPAAEVLLACIANESIGMAIFYMTFASMTGRRAMFLDDLYVKQEWRGLGIGRQLLRRVARLAEARVCARLEWMVLDWNEPAIEFYKGCGATLMTEWIKCRMTEEAIRSLRLL